MNKAILDSWNDDITFCGEECDKVDCFRNQKNIRDHTIPHSYSMERPDDCLKAEKRMTEKEAAEMIRDDMKKHHDYLSGKYRKALRMAAEALEERVPVEPVRDAQTLRIWYCGNCGEFVGFEDHDESDPNEYDKFCRSCGKPVLWRNENV